MTRDVAEKVIRIMLQADGGCPECGARLLRLFMAAFPDYEGMAREAYLNEWDAALVGAPDRELEDDPPTPGGAG